MLERNQNRSTPNQQVRTKELFSASDTKTVEMGIADPTVIYDLLSGLSANNGAYMLREAWSNAYDATKKAKTIKPVEIDFINNSCSINSGNFPTLAEKLSNEPQTSTIAGTVRITDHGDGMTPEEISKYFLQYGGSKKREDNDIDAIGSKGLGAKAPLAVTDLFTVESIHNGIRTFATVRRAQEGANEADVTTSQTTNPNGTTVTIPVPSSTDYQNAWDCAQKIAQNLVDPLLILNGKTIEPLFSDAPITMLHSKSFRGTNSRLRINDITLADQPIRVWSTFNYFMLADRNLDLSDTNLSPNVVASKSGIYEWFMRNCDICVLLGGVAYRLPVANYKLADVVTPNSTPNITWADIVCEIPAGFLNFTPSRDEIKLDKAALDLRHTLVIALLTHDFQQDFINCILSGNAAVTKQFIRESFVESDGTLYLSPRYKCAGKAREYKLDFSSIPDGTYKSLVTLLKNTDKQGNLFLFARNMLPSNNRLTCIKHILVFYDHNIEPQQNFDTELDTPVRNIYSALLQSLQQVRTGAHKIDLVMMESVPNPGYLRRKLIAKVKDPNHNFVALLVAKRPVLDALMSIKDDLSVLFDSVTLTTQAEYTGFPATRSGKPRLTPLPRAQTSGYTLQPDGSYCYSMTHMSLADTFKTVDANKIAVVNFDRQPSLDLFTSERLAWLPSVLRVNALSKNVPVPEHILLLSNITKNQLKTIKARNIPLFASRNSELILADDTTSQAAYLPGLHACVSLDDLVKACSDLDKQFIYACVAFIKASYILYDHSYGTIRPYSQLECMNRAMCIIERLSIDDPLIKTLRSAFVEPTSNRWQTDHSTDINNSLRKSLNARELGNFFTSAIPKPLQDILYAVFTGNIRVIDEHHALEGMARCMLKVLNAATMLYQLLNITPYYNVSVIKSDIPQKLPVNLAVKVQLSSLINNIYEEPTSDEFTKLLEHFYK